MSELARWAVLGAGNWGTTVANLIGSNGLEVALWTRSPEQRDEINRSHTNEKAVKGLVIAKRVVATVSLQEAIDEAEVVLIAIPSQAFREVCRAAGELLRPEHLVLHVTKGLENETQKRMSEILLEETCVRQLGVVSGPNIAAEVAAGKPAGTVVASRFPRVVEHGRRALSSPRMMVFTGTDVPGIELCGALKNVVAIAAGIADELAVGDNAKAFLVTRGLAELMRLAYAMGAEPLTLTGLAGIGDLMVTCASPLSRNHRVGVALAKGATLKEAVASLGMVAEGVHASRSARVLAGVHGIELPLFESVDRVLHEGLSPQKAIEHLMGLPSGRDVPHFIAGARSGASVRSPRPSLH